MSSSNPWFYMMALSERNEYMQDGMMFSWWFFQNLETSTGFTSPPALAVAFDLHTGFRETGCYVVLLVFQYPYMTTKQIHSHLLRGSLKRILLTLSFTITDMYIISGSCLFWTSCQTDSEISSYIMSCTEDFGGLSCYHMQTHTSSIWTISVYCSSLWLCTGSTYLFQSSRWSEDPELTPWTTAEGWYSSWLDLADEEIRTMISFNITDTWTHHPCYELRVMLFVQI